MLDNNIDKNFDMDPIDRSLSIEKCEEYLSLFDNGIYKDFAQKIINDTIYVDYKTFKNIFLNRSKILLKE